MPPEVLESGSYLLEQSIRYTYDSPVRRLRHRLMVVPRSPHGDQVVTTWDIVVSGASLTRAMRTDVYGNQVLELSGDRVEQGVEFFITAQVEGAVGANGLVPLGPGRALGDVCSFTALTAADDRITEAAAELGGRAHSALDLAERACSWAHSSMSYQYGVTNVLTTAAAALSGGKGVCQDYAHIMLALCRAAGLAARYVSGHLMGEGGSHAWVEVVVGPSLAVAFDPTHDRRAGDGYLTVAVGRDYTDVAPTSGTFSGRGPGALSVNKRLAYVEARRNVS